MPFVRSADLAPYSIGKTNMLLAGRIVLISILSTPVTKNKKMKPISIKLFIYEIIRIAKNTSSLFFKVTLL